MGGIVYDGGVSRRRRLEPFETEIRGLARDGAGVGEAPDGHPVVVRGAPPGSRVAVIPGSRRKGVWAGRRAAMIRPPAAYEPPPCPVFGLCGGCSLQELGLDAQRDAKHHYGLDAVRKGWTLGGAAFPDDAKSPEDLFRASDEALYESKNAGRNRVTAYTRK